MNAGANQKEGNRSILRLTFVFWSWADFCLSPFLHAGGGRCCFYLYEVSVLVKHREEEKRRGLLVHNSRINEKKKKTFLSSLTADDQTPAQKQPLRLYPSMIFFFHHFFSLGDALHLTTAASVLNALRRAVSRFHRSDGNIIWPNNDKIPHPSCHPVDL